MGMYKRIVTATDGSPSSELAVRHAVGLSKVHGCPLDIIYVAPPLNESLDFYHSEDLEKALRNEAEGFLARAKEEAAGQGIEAATHILAGEPEDEIVRFAEEKDCDLIVMGSHGHKGFVKLLIGSVAERVIGRAHCPVLVMKHS